MELARVKEIENAIAHNELSPAQVFTQMKQLVYREAPCHAFCESKAFKSNIKGLESEIEQLRAELEKLKSELPSIKADAICDAIAKNKESFLDGGEEWLCEVDNLLEYAEKVRRGEV